jgi:hypothetical protein
MAVLASCGHAESRRGFEFYDKPLIQRAVWGINSPNAAPMLEFD